MPVACQAQHFPMTLTVLDVAEWFSDVSGGIRTYLLVHDERGRAGHLSASTRRILALASAPLHGRGLARRALAASRSRSWDDVFDALLAAYQSVSHEREFFLQRRTLRSLWQPLPSD